MRRGPIIAAGVIVAIAAAGVLTLARTLGEGGAVEEMRENVNELRMAADSCRTVLDRSHGELLEYNERLDSMRGRVREMEALHPRGVPADSYGVYMGAFSRYNDSAGTWGDRVNELQVELEDCRVLTETHNAALDSLRRLLRETQR
ncbi:hypothetical protein BH23GEM9_BH23GEM9_12550 [soil metagenome]